MLRCEKGRTQSLPQRNSWADSSNHGNPVCLSTQTPAARRSSLRATWDGPPGWALPGGERAGADWGGGPHSFNSPFPVPTARRAPGGGEVRASGGPRTTELRPHLRGPRHGEVTACAAPAGGIPGEHTGKTVQVLRPLKSARAWGGRRPSRPVLIKGLGSLQRPRGRGRRQVCRGQHCFARCLPATAATLTGGGHPRCG